MMIYEFVFKALAVLLFVHQTSPQDRESGARVKKGGRRKESSMYMIVKGISFYDNDGGEKCLQSSALTFDNRQNAKEFIEF